ncbi:unnamed protein product [Closterium sp. Yama58-4]|nr:unnamed protein product [Closterium sp. Yama58-4]
MDSLGGSLDFMDDDLPFEPLPADEDTCQTCPAECRCGATSELDDSLLEPIDTLDDDSPSAAPSPTDLLAIPASMARASAMALAPTPVSARPIASHPKATDIPPVITHRSFFSHAQRARRQLEVRGRLSSLWTHARGVHCTEQWLGLVCCPHPGAAHASQWQPLSASLGCLAAPLPPLCSSTPPPNHPMQGDTCESLAASLAISSLSLQELNPGFNCSSPLPASRSLCIEREDGADDGRGEYCNTDYSVSGTTSCAQVVQDFEFYSLIELYRLNPGLVCYISQTANRELPGVPGAVQADHPLMLPASEFRTYLHTLGVNGTAGWHDATRLAQRPAFTSSYSQHAHSLSTPFHLLCTLVFVAYIALNALVTLLWRMGVSYPQVNSWVHEQKVAVTTKLWALIFTWAREIVDEARFTLRSVYEAVGITLRGLVGVSELAMQLKELREQLAEAKKDLAEHRNLITGQAEELAASRGQVEAGLEEALVSLVRGEWGSTRMLDAVSSALTEKNDRRTSLQLKNLSSISDTALHVVSAMTHLKSIDLDKSSGFSAEGVKHLYRLPQKKRLSLMKTAVFDSHLEGIGAASSLERLYLSCTKVTDSGLQQLTGLALKTLELNGCQGVTAAGMAHVGKLRGLESLFLGNLTTKGDGLEHLSSLTNLKLLVLPSGAAGKGLEHVRHLTALQKLDMTGSRVADGGVPWLSNLPSLTHIRTD